MSDIFLGILLIALCYVGSVVFSIILFKFFFPLNVKIAGQDKSTHSFSSGDSSWTKNSGYEEAVCRRKEWVKLNS
jgi:hypothetical protein